MLYDNQLAILKKLENCEYRGFDNLDPKNKNLKPFKYWFKATAGIGKTTIICELVKKYKYDKNLIIVNKYNYFIWKAKLAKNGIKYNLLTSENSIQNLNESNVYLVLDETFNKNFTMFDFLFSKKWDRIIIDEYCKMMVIPESRVIWFVSDTTYSPKHLNHVKDIFYKDLVENFLIVSHVLFLEKETKARVKLCENVKYNEYIEKFDGEYKKNKQYLIICKNMPIDKKPDLYLNKSSTAQNVVNTQALYQSKKYNKLYLIECNDIHSISLNKTDFIIVNDESELYYINKIIGRCDRLTTKNNVSVMINY